MGSGDKITTRPGREVADDRGLDINFWLHMATLERDAKPVNAPSHNFCIVRYKCMTIMIVDALYMPPKSGMLGKPETEDRARGGCHKLQKVSCSLYKQLFVWYCNDIGSSVANTLFCGILLQIPRDEEKGASNRDTIREKV